MAHPINRLSVNVGTSEVCLCEMKKESPAVCSLTVVVVVRRLVRCGHDPSMARHLLQAIKVSAVCVRVRLMIVVSAA